MSAIASKKACGVLNLSSAPGKPRVLEDVFDVGLGRSAAVVADPVEAHRVSERGVSRLDGEHDLAVRSSEKVT